MYYGAGCTRLLNESSATATTAKITSAAYHSLIEMDCDGGGLVVSQSRYGIVFVLVC